MNVPPEFLARVAKIQRARSAALTDKQVTEIADRLAQIEAASPYPLWNYDAVLQETYIAVGLDRLVHEEPEHFRIAPSAKAYVDHLVAKMQATGKAVSGIDRLTIEHEVSSLTPDDILARTADTEILKAKATSVVPPSAPPNWKVDDATARLDAEVAARTGKYAHEMGAVERRKWHDKLTGEAEQTNRSALHLQAADARPADNLSPAERLSRHRRATAKQG